MKVLISDNPDYKSWLIELKSKIYSVQLKAAVTINSQLLTFYWDLGSMITEKQTQWGSRFLENLSKDLQNEFPEMKGFSVTNLKYCKLFFTYFSSIRPQAGDELQDSIRPQVGDDVIFKIPWGHIKLIIGKLKNREEALFYIHQTIENGWSRDGLAIQIKIGLFERHGKAITNFRNTLPDPVSELAQQTLKDPYVFDFLTLSKPYFEKDIENQLITHITKFLLELGKGFAFVGKQYHLEIGEKDYYIDLLFYHTRLKCYVVIEIKNTGFIPEYAGKLNFYLSAVDSMVKQQDDHATIGILLCRDKNNIEAEFALRGINKPIGVSEFQFTEVLPENLKSNLPTIEEIENELKILE